MQYISSSNGAEGVEQMAEKIIDSLLAGKKVLWLICGGSNIPLAKKAMDMVRERAGEKVSNLAIGQTDERFGPVGHKDSNWQQMIDERFDFKDAKTLPILSGEPLKETVRNYAEALGEAFEGNDIVVAQFGIGADGHIAGMLPHTGGIEAKELVFGYEAEPFVRITMTPPAFAYIHAAYAFAFGQSKLEAVDHLQNSDLPLEDEPCQILKTIPECCFYSDKLD
jgi:6-phosphogluconolactonase/glucosamine-6-phosphate isomerase/deaminase